jgi:peptide methionine sulfoxide reductase MsrB
MSTPEAERTSKCGWRSTVQSISDDFIFIRKERGLTRFTNDVKSYVGDSLKKVKFVFRQGMGKKKQKEVHLRMIVATEFGKYFQLDVHRLIGKKGKLRVIT